MDRACEFDQDACKLEKRWNHFVPSDNETWASKARTGQETACRLHVSEYGWGDVACLKYNETELE